MNVRWVLSCEHGGKEIPDTFTPLFQQAKEVLKSHRGWDPGALELFQVLKPLADFSISSTVSRLLVELNRSLHHPKLFSVYTSSLPDPAKQNVLEEYYQPYRQRLQQAIEGYSREQHRVYHLSIHSFTPVLDGEVRKADIGLLYDPKRAQEKEFCARWKAILQGKLPDMHIRYNYPYRGTADGFTTYLRRQFPQQYGGIEVELNQKWAGNQEVYQAIRASLEELKTTIK